MNTLNELTLTQALDGLKQKKFSSVELTQACLDQIKKVEPKINAFVTVCQENALEEAKKADALLQNGSDLPLLGIPVAVKDNFCTKGIKTTASSKVLDDFIPPYDATVVKKLKDAGAILLGKTNLDAWAHGSSGENSESDPKNPTKNPYNQKYVPGGSSSGSAAALAADMCFASTGTDTGGSIRLPASFCNVVGLKPTYGRVSRNGIIAMASSLDSIGHFTKTVEDSALMLSITAGHDPMDATTATKPLSNYLSLFSKSLNGMRIGMPKQWRNREMEIKTFGLYNEAMQLITKKLGAKIVPIDIKHEKYANACYYIIQPSEVSSNLARYDGIRYGHDRSKFGEEAKRRVMLGTYTLSAGYYDAYYKKAMQVRTLIKQDFDETWNKVDAIIIPVSPTPPWKVGEKINDPLKMYLSDVLTVIANLAGIPGLAVSMGFVDGLPVGLQILGPQFSEENLFQIGHAYERATKWHKMKPIL